MFLDITIVSTMTKSVINGNRQKSDKITDYSNKNKDNNNSRRTDRKEVGMGGEGIHSGNVLSISWSFARLYSCFVKGCPTKA